MFLKDTEIEVNWLLPATTEIQNFNHFDVIVRKPDGSSTYNEAAILEADFIQPTPNTTGGATYRLTPDTVGVWVIILTIGDAPDSDLYNEYFMRVSVADNHIYQQINLG